MKTARVALIQCPSWGTYLPPLGISYLASYLRSKGHKVYQFDLNIELFDSLNEHYKKYWKCGVLDFDRIWTSRWLLWRKIPPINFLLIKRWAKRILDINPDVVCFSVVFTTQLTSIMLAREIKRMTKSKNNENKIIIFGGFNCNFPHEIKRIMDSGYVDIIVKGEGEYIMGDLLSKLQKYAAKHAVFGALEAFKEYPGVIIKKDGKIINSGERLPIKNLDELPFPDFTDLPMDKYTNKFMIPILMSRGCVNKCVFCIEHKIAKYYRTRSAENILKEIKLRIKQYPERRYFNFNDSLINGNIRELEKLCDLIINEKLNIEWEGNAAISGNLTLRLLKKMRKSGCVRLVFGIESASQKILNEMGKRFHINEAEKVLRDTYKAGIKPITNWIIGFPTETEEDFNKTLDFIKRNKEYIYVGPPWGSPCVVMPHTDLWLNLESYNICRGGSGSDWRTMDMINVNNPKIRATRLERFKNLASSLGINFES